MSETKREREREKERERERERVTGSKEAMGQKLVGGEHAERLTTASDT
jgi:hypothetical protein